MTRPADWNTISRKLVAILRGLRPDETRSVTARLIEAGFQAIEIPLNSPEPFQSLEIAVRTAEELSSGPCLIGSGTVLTKQDVRRVAECGATLAVSPNVDPEIIREARNLSLISMPGVFTATEALTAAKAGASALKFFPASVLGASGISAIRAILPPNLNLCAVGGISEADFADYAASGISGFGLGSSLYAPGRSAEDVGSRADNIIQDYDRIFGRSTD